MVRQRNGRAKNGEPKLDKDLFIVEAFVDRRRTANGTLQVLVKWKDYPNSHNTWEAAKNVAHCREIVNEFRERRLAEGFEDSEYESDFTPQEPPPEAPKPPTKKRRRSAKQRQTEEPEGGQSEASTTEMAEVVSMSLSSLNDTSITSDRSILTNWSHSDAPEPTMDVFDTSIDGTITAIRVLSTTIHDDMRYFCLLVSNGTKLWFTNSFVRKHYPQLLIDYYESCVTGDVTLPPAAITGPVAPDPTSIPSSSTQQPLEKPWSSQPSVPDRGESVPPALPSNNYMGLGDAFANRPQPPPQPAQINSNAMPRSFYPSQYPQQQQQHPMYQQPLMPLDYSQPTPHQQPAPPPPPPQQQQHQPVNPGPLYFDQSFENPETDWFS